MTAPLEDLLARLGKSPPDHALLGLETRVWARIAARAREMSPAALWGWRSAAAALLLTLGLVVGGATGAQAAADAGVFTTRAALAPSTLLGEAP
jgi:hypothetical protein